MNLLDRMSFADGRICNDAHVNMATSWPFGVFPWCILACYLDTGMLPCLVPSWPQSMQLCISFRSRSGDADHALDFSILSRFSGVSLVS